MPGYRTDGTQNDSFWHNAEFDKLFDQVDSELWYGLAHSGSTRRSVRAPDIGRGVGDHVQRIRRYTVRQGTVEDLIRRVQEGFVPIVRNMPGFRGYYLVNGGLEVLIAISVFDNADGALASNEQAADWVKNNVLDSATGRPEVIVGDVVISEVK